MNIMRKKFKRSPSKLSRFRTRSYLLFVIALILMLPNGHAEPNIDEQEFYVVVHKSNSIDSITIGQLGRIFTKKTKKFENDVPALPVAQKNSRLVTEYFNRVVLKKNAQQLKYYWSRKMFSGSSKPPKSLSSDTEVLKFVSSLKNAIGYVRKIPKDSDVKVILIK